MNAQRLVVIGAAVLGAATPVLPWRQLGMLTVPLTRDAEYALALAAGFLVAAVVALLGDKKKPIRSSKGHAMALSVIGVGLLGFVTLIWSLLPKQVELGVGALAAWGLGAVVAFVSWMDFGD